jgi:secreted trypsin-like serine protease
MKIFNLPVLAALTVLAIACAPTAKNSANVNGATGIINGSNVADGSTLSQSIVGLYDMKRGALCTGSLIGDNVVLTAAHCIGEKPSDMIVVFSADMEGTLKKGEADREFLKQHLRLVAKTIVNEDFKKAHKEDDAHGDIALIRFSGTLPAGFKPASFLASTTLLDKGSKVTLAGYGVDQDKVIDVPVSDSAEFKKGLAEGEILCDNADLKKAKCFSEEKSGAAILRTTEVEVEGALNDSEIVLNQTHGTGACSGDSGGPAYVKVNDQYQLWGVTSRGTLGCVGEHGFMVYTDITAQKQWMDKNLLEIAK